MNTASNPIADDRLPAGAALHTFEFGAGADERARALSTAPCTHWASLAQHAAPLVVLALACAAESAHELATQAHERLELHAGAGNCTTISLQGAHVVWSRGKVVVVATSERLESAVRAVVDVASREHELHVLETQVDGLWPAIEAAAPLAFDFDPRQAERRADLQRDFVRLVGLRARHARLMPHVHVPHVQPPTLASQIAERVRERTRMPERFEQLAVRLDAQERVFDMCSQRASDHALARRGHALEWVIILFLAAQTVLWLLEVLATSSST